MVALKPWIGGSADRLQVDIKLPHGVHIDFIDIRGIECLLFFYSKKKPFARSLGNSVIPL